MFMINLNGYYVKAFGQVLIFKHFFVANDLAEMFGGTVVIAL